MKQASVLQHICLTIILMCIAFINQFLFKQFFSHFFATKLNITIVTCLYLSHLIWQNHLPAGRLMLLTVTLCIALTCLVYVQSLPNLSLIYLCLIWISRSLLRYTNAWAIFADLALCFISASAAFGALIASGSILISLWSLLWVQALYTLIPSSNQPTQSPPYTSNDNFELALQTAERALQKLI